ncbi:MAG: ABC transporter permease [Bacteroidetes bacterium]|nr:ABC transporter permease [Bacteroidota bacterium]
MQQFIIFVRKEFLHIFRDRKSLLIIFALPIVQILIFGFALTNEIKNTKIGVLDLSKDVQTATLIQQLDASKYFEVSLLAKSQQEINDAFAKDNITLAVIFPENFNEQLSQNNYTQLQLIADATDPNTATTVVVYASNIVQDFMKNMNTAVAAPMTITPEIRMIYNPQLKGAFIFVPGVMGMILLLISAMMTSIAIVREKELNTMEVILASPLKPMVLILSKAVPYIIISFINVLTILLLSVTVLELPIKGDLLLLFGVCLLFITTAISLGLMISNITNSMQVAMFISLVGLMLPTLLLSGFMFPIENMPMPLQIFSNIIPTKWFFIIIKDVMIKGLGIQSIWKEMMILTGMTLFFLIVSWRNFKIRLE